MTSKLSHAGVSAVALALLAYPVHWVAAEQKIETPLTAELGSSRLQQVALTTTDLSRAVAFYRDKLGLRLLFETNGMAFFNVGGIRLMIARDTKRAVQRPATIVYFDAPQFETTLAKLKAVKVTFEGPVETVQRTAAGELKLQQFQDPDGNALAIMGLVPDT